MPMLHYDADAHIAIADTPIFPSEEEAASITYPKMTPLVLQEIQPYFVKFYEKAALFLSKGSSLVQREFPGRVFEINFRNSVGMTRLGPVNVKVQNKKIDDDMYQSILDYIAGKFADLVFSFNVPLGQSYWKNRQGNDIAYVEYLFIKKFLLDRSPDLEAIANLIAANPHNKILSTFQTNSIESIRHYNQTMMLDLFLSPDKFAVLQPGHTLMATSLGRRLLKKTGRGFFPTKANEELKYNTVDTHENRFVKYFLETIQKKLVSFKAALIEISGSFLNPDIEQNIHTLKKKVQLFLSDPLWDDVGPLHFIPANSQVLQRREGYRHLFKLYSLLQLATHCDFDSDDFKNLLETKNTPTLFEYWSFFLIKDIIDQKNRIISCRPVVCSGPVEQRLNKGISIVYDGGYCLWFNKTFQGSPGHLPMETEKNIYPYNDSYSHNLIPDIVLSKGDNHLIFDAKYKGQRGGFYGDESPTGIIQSYKEEDLDKMHTYREAIKNVSGAFILYPGSKTEIFTIPEDPYPHKGVGALPLQPMAGGKPNQEHIENIKYIIESFMEHSR
jgi:uncharacterized protein